MQNGDDAVGGRGDCVMAIWCSWVAAGCATSSAAPSAPPPSRLHTNKVMLILLMFQRPAFAYANTHKNTYRNSFYILRQQENPLHFKTCCTMFVLFYTKCHLFRKFIYCPNNMFLIKHALIFKYPSRKDEG